MVKLSIATVLQGSDYKYDVALPYYDGETVTVRPLTDAEFAGVRERSGLLELAREMETSKDENAVDVVKADSCLAKMHLELCKIGIVDPKLRNGAEKLMGGSIQILGEQILKLTTASRAELLTFREQSGRDESADNTDSGVSA